MSKRGGEGGDDDNGQGYAGFKKGFDNEEQYYASKKKKLNDNILIDFFLSVGLPSSMIIDLLKFVDQKFDGEGRHHEIWKYLGRHLEN